VELYDLYCSPNIIRLIKSRRMRWARHVARRGKHEGKRPLGRPRRRWEDNIEMNLQDVGRGPWTELSVALVIQNAVRMHRILVSCVVFPFVQDFFTLSHEPYDYGQKFTKHKICYLIFSTTFVRHISHSKNK